MRVHAAHVQPEPAEHRQSMRVEPPHLSFLLSLGSPGVHHVLLVKVQLNLQREEGTMSSWGSADWRVAALLRRSQEL